ncbi:hypothetical protein Bca52824_016867 [Brassica carinata]|uniref:Uncharacterized protein n=1 Tax=Brassica carinata TaxID=52824 RepID=A0A8X7W4D9_BRACI|nr:hypothetical protein Bca52824_016867 [Brassica carinata]
MVGYRRNPSESEEYGENSADSGYSQTEADILLDQAKIVSGRLQYPPQPEVEFGFPMLLWWPTACRYVLHKK